jgi:hypothetical protein
MPRLDWFTTNGTVTSYTDPSINGPKDVMSS